MSIQVTPQTYPALPSPDAPLAEWAQWYATQGIPVFPCRGKRPLTQTGFYDAATDAFTVSMWWRKWPDANIATPTGGWCWVLDVDPRHGGDISRDTLIATHGAFQDTAVSLTGGGGEHWVFLPDSSVQHHKKLSLPGLDIQATGGYVILPPSIHPDTGKAYVWDLGADLENPGIAEAPDWLLRLVSRGGEGQANGQTAPERQTPDTSEGEPILEGQPSRNKTLSNLGYAMRRAGLSYTAILAALQETNIKRCVPPLAGSDIQTIAWSATRASIDPVLDVAAPQANSGILWEAGKAPAFVPTLFDAADLLQQYYPLPQWIIKGLIPEGLTFFAGSPKSSKTYLAYSLGLSLALQGLTDGLWLDHYDIRMTGPVVYFTLEDDEADSKQRILELMPQLKTIPRGRLIFHHGVTIPELGAGLTEMLEDQIVKPYTPALIVIDPISYVYAAVKKGVEQFTGVRTMLLPLRTLARKYHFSIIGVDHRRKKNADDLDVFETIYGSQAKGAIADSMLLIVRDDKEITVHCKVRKGEDQTLTLGFHFTDDGVAHWEWKGSHNGIASTGQYGDLRQKILLTLMRTRTVMSITDLLHELEIPDSRAMRHNFATILYRLVKTNEVQRTVKGSFIFSVEV